MAILLKDRIKETTNVVGTGNATLLGAGSTYLPFSTLGDGNTTYYCIVDLENGAWEVGLGTYETTGNYLARNTVLSNSLQTTAKIDFAAGSKDIFVTYPAEKAIYEEETGNVLIDGGPITVLGTGVTSYTTFSAALGKTHCGVAVQVRNFFPICTHSGVPWFKGPVISYSQVTYFSWKLAHVPDWKVFTH